MKTRNFLILWHIYALTYACIFIAFFAVIPEVKLFTWFSTKYGFIDVESWDLWYTVFALAATLLVNGIIIGVTFNIFKNRNNDK